MQETIQTDILQEEPTEKQENLSFENYTKKQITLVGYLLGIKDVILKNQPFDQEYLQKIKDKREIKIIRALSNLRMNFMCAYEKIYGEKQVKGPFAQFENMEELIDVPALKYLRAQGFEPLQYGINLSEFTKHIANINQLIEENIENIHKFVPEWIKWEYIKELFIMPDCASGPKGNNYNNRHKASQINTKIHEIRKDFYNNINFYPYKVYLNWNEKRRPDDYGNILFNDGKFLKLLYSSNYDEFTGSEYVIDAKAHTKNDIYDFVAQATNIAIFVDCENVDPYHFAAAIKNLDEEKINKIKKVVLYDDINTTNAWDILQDILNLPVEHEEVERVKDDKSLVDHALSIGVTKSFYEEQTESVIIASSDSDFWSLMKYLPKIRFFVMNETRRTSDAVIDKLDANSIAHCYMDEFAQDAIQPYKNMVLRKNLQIILDSFNNSGTLEPLSVEEMLETVFRRSYVSGHYKQIEKEKEDFYNRYVKKIHLTIKECDGHNYFKMEIGK